MADRKVRRMSTTEAKTYMMLLHEAFICSTRPNLPDDEEELYLMAYCTDRREWDSVKDAVLGMFDKDVVEGVPVLTNKRLVKDWARLQEIREARSEAGKASAAKRKSTNVQQTSTIGNKEVSKEVKEVREEKEESTPEPLSFENEDGQGEDMNLKTFKAEMTGVGVRCGQKVKGYDNTWDELRILGIAHGYSAVVRDFEEFLNETPGNEYPKGALVAYSWAAADRLRADSPVQASAKDPEVVSLARELTYLSDGQISFGDKHRVRLAEVLKEFTAVEIQSVFRTWLQDQDLTDPKNLGYLPGNFVQKVDGLAYTSRRKAEEAKQAQKDRDTAVARLQAEAEADRLKREGTKNQENNLVDPVFGGETVV
jgi:uncharacterized protein YdaU (DUF1376 family)